MDTSTIDHTALIVRVAVAAALAVTGCDAEDDGEGSDSDAAMDTLLWPPASTGTGTSTGASDPSLPGTSDANPDTSVPVETADTSVPVETPDTGADTETPSSMPLYAVVTQIFSANSQTSYAVLTESLAPGVALDTSAAVELPGRALGFGLSKAGTLFIGGTDGPSIQRYGLLEDQTLTLENELSLINQGVSYIGEYQGQMQFASETAAFYFDGSSAQVVVWNPAEMLIDGVIALPELARSETILTFSSSPVLLDGRIYAPAAWRSADNTTIIPESAMVVVDVASRTATVVLDTRCGYAREAVEGGDGFIYMATEAYGAAVRRVAPGNAPSPCLLRFDVATGAYDPGFYVDLNALTGAPAAGSIYPAGPGEAWIRTLDEALVDVSVDVHPRVLASAIAWEWSKVVLGSEPTATASDTLPAGNGSTFVWAVDAGIVISEFAEDRSSTSLRNLNDGSVGASIPGLAFSIVQLR